MNSCFGTQDNNLRTHCTLLLQSLPNPSASMDCEATASSAPVVMSGNHSGLRTFLKRANPFSIQYDGVDSILNSQQSLIVQEVETFVKDEFKILPVKSHKDRNDDRQAGGSAEVGGSVRWGGADGPQYDAYVKAEAHDDKGNYVETEVEHNFNTGEGSADIRGGSEK